MGNSRSHTMIEKYLFYPQIKALDINMRNALLFPQPSF